MPPTLRLSAKQLKALVGVIVALIAFCYAAWAGIEGEPVDQYVETLEGKSVPIDPNITFEYGKPIQVIHTVDGDTVQLSNGDYVRYIGIDTPEKNDPRKPVQCFAAEASEANKSLVQGQFIVVEKDVTERDKYGRLLGYIYLSDGTFVNKKLVEGGYAFSYPYKPDTGKQEELNVVEASAKLASLGLWAACTVETLSSGRKQTNSL